MVEAIITALSRIRWLLGMGTRRSNTSTAINTTPTTGTPMTGRSANRIRIGIATRRCATRIRTTPTCIIGTATVDPRHC